MNIQTQYIRAQRAREHYKKLFRPLHDSVRPLGYALTLHGSLSRDLDFVAVPWWRKIATPQDVFETIIEKAREINGAAFLTPGKEREFPRKQRQGRLCWSIWLDDLVYIDLSVSQPVPKTVFKIGSFTLVRTV